MHDKHLQSLSTETTAAAIPLRLVTAAALPALAASLEDAGQSQWLDSSGFKAKPGSHCLLPDAAGRIAQVLVGIDPVCDAFALGGLAQQLPEGRYRLLDAERFDATALAIGWGLGAYRFDRYKPRERAPAVLELPTAADAAQVLRDVACIGLARDLINTPAADMMPQDLAVSVEQLGTEFGAEVTQVVGEALLAQRYPCIHAVGRASRHAPRLIDLRWGDPAAPRLTLVGKGICFDSGGLDIKPASAMRLMKKDMGGAAHALALARMIMAAALPVRLRLLVAAAENAVSGDSFRPGDVLSTRKGLSVEIDNTDAEGRLVLCDALAEADSERPALIVDFATLTGAARVAVGTEIAALFSNRDEIAQQLMRLGMELGDPVWQLPLHRPYRSMLDSSIADLANSSAGPYAGAITAALFLAEFVAADTPWVHLDVMAWNTRARPGRPEGGEAMGLRTLFAYLRQRFPA